MTAAEVAEYQRRVRELDVAGVGTMTRLKALAVTALMLDDVLLDELGAGRESLAEAEERRYREYMESQPDLGE